MSSNKIKKKGSLCFVFYGLSLAVDSHSVRAEDFYVIVYYYHKNNLLNVIYMYMK